MSLKHVIVAGAATMSMSLPGALCAQAQSAPVVEGGTSATRTIRVIEGAAAPAPVAEDTAAVDPIIESNAAADQAAAEPRAETTAAPATGQASAVQVAEDDAVTAQEYKRQKMDEATAADDKFHANRTQANMIARDKSEAEAAAAIDRAHAAEDRASAARKSAARAGNPR